MISSALKSAAESAETFDDLFRALNTGSWEQARRIAKDLDVQSKRGDIFLAFADSVIAANNGNCKDAKTLARFVIQKAPGLLPIYDILAGCLIKEGNKADAAQVYQDLANSLSDIQDKEIAQRKADSLKLDLSPRLTVDLLVTPSTNTSRRTARTTVGNNFELTDESRAQDGVTVSSNFQLVKPIFNNERLLSQVSLKLGVRYDSVTDNVLPLVGGEFRNTWFLDKTRSAYAATFYEYTWLSGNRFFDEYGLRFGGTMRLNARSQLTANFIVSERDFEEAGRDQTFLFGSFEHRVLLNERNRLSTFVNLADTDADNRFFSFSDQSIGFRLETIHENGFVTSLSGLFGERGFERLAAATSDLQEDTYYTGSFGLSHKKLVFKDVRPELVYTYTNQSSNSVFNDFSAHDIGIKLIANY